MSHNRDFWDRQRPHSKVKTEIAVQYFRKWANIMKTRAEKLTYLDLCSGRGIFRDGTLSTPLLILDEAIKDPLICKKLHSHFLEEDTDCYNVLKREIAGRSSYRLLDHPPNVQNCEITSEVIDRLPIDECTFTFIDPWGYDVLSMELLQKAIGKWGNDCLFYISVDGVRRNLDIPAEQEDLTKIFSEAGLTELKEFEPRRSRARSFHQQLILSLKKALASTTRKSLYTIPFAVEKEERRTVSHYLVFLCKSWVGFDKMKSIMADRSLSNTEGEPCYRWRNLSHVQPIDFPSNYSHIKSTLLRINHSKVLSVGTIIEQYHTAGYYGTSRNLKAALEQLLDQGVITARSPNDGKRHRSKVYDDLFIKFPEN